MFLPIALSAQTATEKHILEELQKLNQRMERIERKLEASPPVTGSWNDPEKKVFGMRLSHGPKGNRVTSVHQGSPADKSGLKPGDLITSLDGKDVSSLPGQNLLRELETKDKFTFVVERKGGHNTEISMAKARQGDFMLKNGGFALVPGEQSLSELEVGQPAPEVTAKDSAGHEMKLSALKGKVVLVNFTATWCGPCKKELPELARLHKERHGEGFEIISVFCDSDQTAVDHYIKENNIPWPYVFDGKGWDTAVAREWGISGVPTNAIVSKRGLIAKDNVRGAAIQPAVEQYLDEN